MWNSFDFCFPLELSDSRNFVRKLYHSDLKNVLTDFDPMFKLVTLDNGKTRLDLLVPGLDKDEISVEVKNDTLTVSICPKDKNAETYRYSKNIKHTYTLPKSAEVVSASLQNGILSIFMQEKEECRPKQIEITQI